MSRAVVVVVVAACAASHTAPLSQPQVVTSDFEPVRAAPGTAQPATVEPASGSAAGSAATDSVGSGSAAGPGSAAPAPPAPEQPIVFGLLDGELALEEAWERWRAGKTGTYEAVFEIAVLANRARPVAMSDELMVIALARAVELSACDPERLGRIRLLAIAVRTAEHPAELTRELVRLADMGPVECARAMAEPTR